MEVPLSLLREQLTTGKRADAEKIHPYLEQGIVHPHIRIEPITKELLYKGIYPHPLLGREACRGYVHRGLFATKQIPAGTELGEYVGHLTLISRERLATWPHSAYSWFAPIGGQFLVIDPSQVANELVFANDYRGIRSRPNTRGKQIVHRGCYYFGYVTTERIDAREEILVNYGERYRL
jgi:hypothetical protein